MRKEGTSRPPQEDSLFGKSSLRGSPKLGVVRARFEGHEQTSFEDLLTGYSSMRVLTYSNSVSMIAKAAEALDDLEIVFGREDIIGEAVKLFQYQDELLKAVRDEVRGKGPTPSG